MDRSPFELLIAIGTWSAETERISAMSSGTAQPNSGACAAKIQVWQALIGY